VETSELSTALIKAIGDGAEAVSMQRKAKELAELCGKAGGRVLACKKIVDALENL